MIRVDKNLCVGCALCVPVCPEEAIACLGMAWVGETCTGCLMCLEYCPVGALREAEDDKMGA